MLLVIAQDTEPKASGMSKKLSTALRFLFKLTRIHYRNNSDRLKAGSQYWRRRQRQRQRRLRRGVVTSTSTSICSQHLRRYASRPVWSLEQIAHSCATRTMDSDDLLLLLLLRRRCEKAKSRRRRRMWVRPIFQQRRRQGDFHRLLQELTSSSRHREPFPFPENVQRNVRFPCWESGSFSN